MHVGARDALGEPHEAPIGRVLHEADRRWLRERAGCRRYLPLAVTRPCSHGFPAVHLAFHDESRRRTVGSLFWLACPQLLRAVFAIESRGEVEVYRRRVEEDPICRSAHLRLGARYRELRRTLLAWAALEDARPGSFMGVGGVGDPLGVKCLHSHLAFWLSTGEGWIGAELVDRIHEGGMAPCWFGDDSSGLTDCERELT